MISKVLTATALAGSLFVGGAALATTGTTSTTAPVTTTTATPVRVDRGFDYGWLGLLGLAGLAGLMRRKDPIVHTTAHTGTGTGTVHRS